MGSEDSQELNREVKMAKALQGIRVLDFTQAMSGPICTVILKELGAEVIKVEKPGTGDLHRSSPPFTEAGESGTFIYRNRGKKSITLNMASAKGRQIAKELAKKVDILVENFSPHVMEKCGLSYDEIAKVNPKLIYASISGYGHTGPRRDEPSYDIVAQAMGGAMSLNGYPDGPPTKCGIAIGDLTPAYQAVIAILAALHYRMVTGEGQMIDISMQDCVFGTTLGSTEGGGYFIKNEVPKRYGNHHPTIVPFGAFPAKDGYVVICTSRAKFDDFLMTIGREDLIGDPRYTKTSERVKNKHEIIAVTEKWTRDRTVEEILTTLGKAGIPCSPVPTYDEVFHDPQLAARKMITEVDQPRSGKVRVGGSVYKMSKTPGDLMDPSPSLGEHNTEIYANMLGYSDAEIKKFSSEGVI
jgi:crotonobetainyl-CoA:carnitine CoA-transferase CaiB-like acyl-CoA transferase